MARSFKGSTVSGRGNCIDTTSPGSRGTVKVPPIPSSASSFDRPQSETVSPLRNTCIDSRASSAYRGNCRPFCPVVFEVQLFTSLASVAAQSIREGFFGELMLFAPLVMEYKSAGALCSRRCLVACGFIVPDPRARLKQSGKRRTSNVHSGAWTFSGLTTRRRTRNDRPRAIFRQSVENTGVRRPLGVTSAASLGLHLGPSR